MSKAGKRFAAVQAKVEPDKKNSLEDAMALLQETASAKFDETVDVAIRLGVNPKHADQMVRGAVALPHGTGKTVRVIVFAQGEAARAALEAGADVVGGDELVTRIQETSWLDFDKAVATRDMMGKVGRLGKVLGPRGLMPNPKVGTVVGPDEVAETIRELKAGKIDFRVEKAGIVHAAIGRVSMGSEKLVENLTSLLTTLVRLKPGSAKGTYLRSISVSSTMGPGIKIDTLDAQRRAEAL